VGEASGPPERVGGGGDPAERVVLVAGDVAQRVGDRDQVTAQGFEPADVLKLVASLERYSKHPLAHAILASADAARIPLQPVSQISEPPGQGMRGVVGGHTVRITSRGAMGRSPVPGCEALPPHTGGLECFVVIDDRYAAMYRFRDEPRIERHRLTERGAFRADASFVRRMGRVAGDGGAAAAIGLRNQPAADAAIGAGGTNGRWMGQGRVHRSVNTRPADSGRAS